MSHETRIHEILDRLIPLADKWQTNYEEITTYSDDDESYMTQLDHGHEEYGQRIAMMRELRALIDECMREHEVAEATRERQVAT